MKDAFWFRHDANARNDVRMLRLRARFGLEAVGWFWCVIEMLREEADYKLTLESAEGLAMSLQITTDKFNELIATAVDLRLLEQDGQCFWSPALLRRMEAWDDKRKTLSANAKQKLSKCKADDDISRSSLLSSSMDLELEELPKILVKPPAYQDPDSRGNPRLPHPKFPLLWFSELEIKSIEKKFDRVGLRSDFWNEAYANVEQWFTDTTKGRKEYPKSMNHMRRVCSWGVAEALKLQRESDYAKSATARTR